jgi:hypothetical protein
MSLTNPKTLIIKEINFFYSNNFLYLFYNQIVKLKKYINYRKLGCHLIQVVDFE